MAFLSSTDDALTALVHQEPLRFTGTLPLISTRFTPPRTPVRALAAVLRCVWPKTARR